jgi:hypothetical protein
MVAYINVTGVYVISSPLTVVGNCIEGDAVVVI